MNPILNNNFQNQLPPELIKSINNAKQNLQTIRNPQQVINNLVKQCNGMTPEQWVRNMCRNYGIDVQQFINALK